MIGVRTADEIPQLTFSHPEPAPLVLNADGAVLGIDWERIVKESLK